MTVSRLPTGASTRDPYELDRLADELASREQHGEHDGAHDLPVHIPLSHDDKYLSADTFNVQEFLLSRSYTSLPDLRTELRDYLAQLKEELVQLINDDYEAFISLSTDLKDEGTRLEKLSKPLAGLRQEVMKSQTELRAIQDAINDKLERRAVLREKKALLHLLLQISESVKRLESLLLISEPEQETPVDTLRIPDLTLSNNETAGDKSQGNQAKHLGRVATEYTQLLYLTSKAKAQNCVYIDEIQWRIDRIKSTLSSDIDYHFSVTLVNITDSKVDSRSSDSDRAKGLVDLAECLRTYDLLGLWRDAEDVLRREVVREFVKKTIYPGALSIALSPVAPRTPVRASQSPELPQATVPYTQSPPSSLADRNQLRFFGAREDPLINDQDNPLARLYNQILCFVENKLTRIMEIADSVSVKTSADVQTETVFPSPTVADDGVANEFEKGFQFLANVVWDEFGRAIMDEVGGVVFAAGQPNEFRKNYETTQAFIRSLEHLSPSLQSIEAMRKHPVYVSFEHRWQLPVYFQLRWKEMVGGLEEALSSTRLNPSFSKHRKSFTSSQAEAVWTTIRTCWSTEVYVPHLCPRFWRLTLQILSRYKTWLHGCVPADQSLKPLAGVINEKTSSQTLRTGTPTSDITSAESAAADDITLKHSAAIITDIQSLRAHVMRLWQEEICNLIPKADPSMTDNLQEALVKSLANLESYVSLMSNQIITILTRRCCDALLPVRSIPSQFRAMSNKRSPTEPSYFVASILKPVKDFFSLGSDGPGLALQEDFLKTYSSDIFMSVVHRYISFLVAMKKTEESLKRLKKGKKSSFSLFGNPTATREDEIRDDERIRTQMILDVEAFGTEALMLGVQLDGNDAFQMLKGIVYAVDGEI